MPELPEAETIRRALAERVTMQRISSVEVLHPKVIEPLDAASFRQAVQGAQLTKMRRRGKYLLLDLDREGLLVVHLRMTGQLHFIPPALKGEELPELLPHTHLILGMESGAQLRYVDVRRFGKVRYQRCPEEDETLAQLGPEPLDEDFTASDLHAICLLHKAAIKAVLLDQALLAGLGNIYSDEALFLSGIHPERSAASLSEEEVVRLHEAIRFVLMESIEYRGSSLRDYCNIDGERGSYQERWRVYQQTGEPCPICATPIERLRVRGRSSHFCPHCQRR